MNYLKEVPDTISLNETTLELIFKYEQATDSTAQNLSLDPRKPENRSHTNRLETLALLCWCAVVLVLWHFVKKGLGWR